MRGIHLPVYCIFLLLLITFQACQSPDSTPGLTPDPTTTTGTRFRVKSLSEDMPGNGAKVTAFTYDAQGRLSALLSYVTPDSTVTWIEKSSYQYDAQNRLIIHQFQRISRANSIFGPLANKHQFFYNAAGQATEIRYWSSGYAPSGQTVIDLAVLNDINTLGLIGYPRYNASNQVVGIKKVNYAQGQPSTNEANSDFTYSGQNLTFATTVYTSNVGAVPYMRTDQNGLTYDDKINPFYGTYVIPKYFGGIAEFFPNLATLSPHNILTLGGLTYRYEYNASNLPAVRYTYSDRLAETLRFTYESY